eukprot:COSAG06_NODE_455_length_15521_cov_8.312022_4_plen_93_part_00
MAENHQVGLTLRHHPRTTGRRSRRRLHRANQRCCARVLQGGGSRRWPRRRANQRCCAGALLIRSWVELCAGSPLRWRELAVAYSRLPLEGTA